jgi:hypothetical protein
MKTTNQAHHHLYQMYSSATRRTPDWRWQLSEDFDRYIRDVHFLTDRWFLVAGKLRRIEPTAPRAHFFHAREAHYIWQTNNQTRWELEARVLLNQPQQLIADVLKLPIEMVQIYEKLFFDVRDHLSAKDYIGGAVLQPHVPLKPDQVGRIWSRYAFHGGIHPLEALIAHYRELNLTDYSYLLAEPLSRSNRSKLHAAIERALLVDLASSLPDTKEMLIHFERAVNSRPSTSGDTKQQDGSQPSITKQLEAVSHEQIHQPKKQKKGA